MQLGTIEIKDKDHHIQRGMPHYVARGCSIPRDCIIRYSIGLSILATVSSPGKKNANHVRLPHPDQEWCKKKSERDLLKMRWLEYF